MYMSDTTKILINKSIEHYQFARRKIPYVYLGILGISKMLPMFEWKTAYEYLIP